MTVKLASLAAALVLTASWAAAAAPDPAVHLKIHNPRALPREAARVEISLKFLPRGMTGDWVAVAGERIAPLQRTLRGMVTALDLPAEPLVPLLLRPRLPADPASGRLAAASIPVREGEGWREMPNFTVPSDHVIHDPLFPIEGAGWESDRVAYRVYLDKRFANDIFGKKLPAPVLGRIGQGGPSYHEENDWGMDIWHVGDSLGGGGLGVLRDSMATQLGDMKRLAVQVTASGPVLAGLRVDCQGWEWNGRPRALTVDFSVNAGSRLSVNTVSASPGTPLLAGFGKYPNTVFLQSRSGPWGYIASWGRQSENGKDDVGVVLFYPVVDVARTGDDGRSYYVEFRNPAKARYAFAAAWAREPGGLPDQAAFRAYVERTAMELAYPVFVTR